MVFRSWKDLHAELRRPVHDGKVRVYFIHEKIPSSQDDITASLMLCCPNQRIYVTTENFLDFQDFDPSWNLWKMYTRECHAVDFVKVPIRPLCFSYGHIYVQESIMPPEEKSVWTKILLTGFLMTIILAALVMLCGLTY